VSVDALKLTVYFGERDRVGGHFLADRLLEIFASHGLAASVMLRGVEGFGVKHQLHTDRLLTLSEDLPLAAVAVDRADRVQRALDDVRELSFHGLITLERAELLDGASLAGPDDEQLKLSLYFGRGLRAGGRPAYEEAVRVLHDGGVAGATVLVGVDGTIAGERHRGRFFSRNAEVPVMLISIGRAADLRRAAESFGVLPESRVATIERVRTLKRDGTRLSGLDALPEGDANGLDRWLKLMLYSSERNQFDGRPAHIAAVHSLREAGASGATALRGIWGYHGDHQPHGDSFWTVRRRVPTVTVVVDVSERARQWVELLDRVTPSRGLLTVEVVPAFRASGPDVVRGGLRIAERWRA
jgi:PII-like signaling protein